MQAERVNEDKDFHLDNTYVKIIDISLEETMGKYGDAAVKAVRTYTNGRAGSIMDASDIAVAEIFPHSPSSQVKGCPRGTFLGICESEIVSGRIGWSVHKIGEEQGLWLESGSLIA